MSYGVIKATSINQGLGLRHSKQSDRRLTGSGPWLKPRAAVVLTGILNGWTECMLLCFIQLILGNRYDPRLSSKASQFARTLDWKSPTNHLTLSSLKMFKSRSQCRALLYKTSASSSWFLRPKLLKRSTVTTDLGLKRLHTGCRNNSQPSSHRLYLTWPFITHFWLDLYMTVTRQCWSSYCPVD